MDYEIIATLGPASRDESTWLGMLAAGATAFRLNTSHLSLDQLRGWLDRLNAFRTEHPHLPLVLDLQGSKWRLGQFPPFDLREGERITLLHAPETTQPGFLPVPHADFFRAAGVSDGEMVLNDAKIRLRLESAAEGRLLARVTQGGAISPHKGITFASSDYRSENLSDKDQAIIRQIQGMENVRCAISYIKDAAEMAGYRALIQAHTGSLPYLIAKLERGPAMADAAQLAQCADELWVCRGDLGAELGLAGMAKSVSRLSAQVQSLPVPVIMAGQVLEHMTESPTPTRSEVCYLYDTLKLGYRGFVLSDEAAIGKYPVESCRTAGMFKSH